MGSPAKSSSLQTIIMIKSVAAVALCLLAAVAAEAEADAYYGYGYGLGHHYGHGLLYGHGLHHGYGYGHHLGHFYGKRSAEAEPTAAADHPYGYGHHLGHHYGHGLAYGHGYGHGYYGHPYAFGHYYGKRSADAEPAAEADAYYGYPLVAAAPTVSTVHGGPLHGLTSVYGGLYGHYYGKRSADAEPTAAAAPEADAD